MQEKSQELTKLPLYSNLVTSFQPSFLSGYPYDRPSGAGVRECLYTQLSVRLCLLVHLLKDTSLKKRDGGGGEYMRDDRG